jgi:DNA-directed RNA polymerase beta' subunit
MIMDYYLSKYPKKRNVYDDIMMDRSKVFIHSIPVYTTHLRPMDISANNMYFEKCSAMYNMMVKLANQINKDKTHNDRSPKVKSQSLYNLQMKYNELYDEILSIMSGKRGVLRGLVGGRYSHSARSVIRQDPSLRIDQIRLPYVALVIMLKGQIENILHRQYNISYQEAYHKWYNAQAEFDPIIASIIDSLIANGFPNPETGQSEGLPMIINRNPSISYGSIQQCFCIGYNLDYTMSVSLQVLKPLAADFDGRVLYKDIAVVKAFELLETSYNRIATT